MNTGSVGLERGARRRSQGPRSVPWAVAGELDVVAVDTTWGELQPLQCAPDVLTVGELEVLELVQQGAVLIDTRVSGSSNGVTLPGARSLPHVLPVDDRMPRHRGFSVDPARPPPNSVLRDDVTRHGQSRGTGNESGPG